MTRNKIKICFVLFSTYPLFNPKCTAVFGGAEVDLYHLAIKLAENSIYEVMFIVGDYGQNNIEFYNNVKVIKHNHENFRTIEDNKGLTKILKYLDLIRKLSFTDADIYITEGASELLGWMVLLDKVIKRKKVVLRLASDVNTDLDFYRQKNSRRFYHLYKYGLFGADWVISQTERQKIELGKMHIKSSVITNGFIINEGKETQLEKKHILWVGRGVPLKRPQIFIDLARRLPDENFILIMPSYDMEEYSSFTKGVVDSLSELPNVEYLEYVVFQDISKYFEKAKLFVNTSEYEGFPNTFIQACLGKTPILSYRVNPDNFITQNNLGYVCDDSMNAAVNFIRVLDAEKIRYYGENAFVYALRNHNIDNVLEKYSDLFHGLLV